MQKPATTEHPIHDLIAERWSPLAFDHRPVPPAALASLFEAARWAASCFNEQPWRFLVAGAADDPEGFERLAACLVPGNSWAKDAPVLGLSVASSTFARNGNPNRHAFHDVGLASGNLMIQAQALGLVVHMMAGFDGAKARADLGIPTGFDPVAMFALGYPGSGDGLPANLAERQAAPRQRRPLTESFFAARWAEPHPTVG